MNKYKIYLDNLLQHKIRVELFITHADHRQTLSMPSWLPGSYMIREFARNIISISATDSNGNNVSIIKNSKNEFQLENVSGEVKIEYEVYCFDTAPRGAYVTTDEIFFDSARIFLRVLENSDPYSVEILPPDVKYKLKFAKCYNTLKQVKVDKLGFGSYCCDTFEQLIDAPFLVVDGIELNFKVSNTPHVFVLYGNIPHDFDKNKLINDVTAICEGHIKFFGELPEMSKYIFMTRVMPGGYGGIEHCDSTALVCAESNLPRVYNLDKDKYHTLLALISHEYFHLWNVKRIMPLAVAKSKLNKEAYTRSLWVFEGITSYYEIMNLVRSNVISQDDFFKLLKLEFDQYLALTGRNVQTLEQSSFDAWIKFYIRDENSVNSIVSYYGKGALVALCLDLMLLNATDGKSSLQNIMRLVWHEYGIKNVGLPDGYFENILNKELDCREFFTKALRTTECIFEDCVVLLQKLGVQLKLVEDDLIRSHGLRLSNNKITSVINGSSAENAYLAPNDEIVAIADYKITNNVAEVLGLFAPGDEVIVHVFRLGKLKEFKLVIADKNLGKVEINQAIGRTSIANRLFESWINHE